MSRVSRRGRALVLAALTGLLLILAAALAVAEAASPKGDLQALKSATARYNSFEQAKKAGYSVVGEPCVSSPAGTMGVHAINMALLADPAINLRQPEMLLYLPDERGKLKLIGVEYMRIAADQNPADGFAESDKPSLFGRAFDGIMPGHAPWMGWHYDLHVWLYEPNPAGMLAMFNPAISCS